jgi:prepilin-type processing-associated H-X9-DG protein
MYRGVLKLVAISIPVLILLGLGMSAVMRWRESAHRARCQDNLRRVGLFAMWQYADPQMSLPGGPQRLFELPGDARPNAESKFPPGTWPNPELPPEHRLSWQFILLPHLGRDELYSSFNLTKAWDDDANAPPAATKVSELACPTQFDNSSPAIAPYIGVAGLGADAPTLTADDPNAGVFRYDGRTEVGKLKRGLSHTITILESGRHLGPWAAGGPATVRGLDPADTPYIGGNRQFGGHPKGANAAFADGSVRFQSVDIAQKVLENLVTLAQRDQE